VAAPAVGALAFARRVGRGDGVALGVGHGQPGVLRKLRAHGGQVLAQRGVAMLARGGDLRGRAAHDGAARLHRHAQRMADLGGELGEQPLCVAAGLRLGGGGSEIGGQQRGQRRHRGHGQADGGGQVPAGVEPLPGRVHDRAVPFVTRTRGAHGGKLARMNGLAWKRNGRGASCMPRIVARGAAFAARARRAEAQP
jgi:hypothetical protein